MDMLQNSRTVERVSIDKLKDYERSARIHPRQQHHKINRLIKRYGQVWPILVTPDLAIIDGHALRDGLKEAGFTEVDVLVIADQSPTEIKALRLAINRIPLDSKWDQERLRAEFAELLELGFDLELTGFDAPEIDFALKLDIPSANFTEDSNSIPSPQGPAVSKRGDIFQLGKHRIGCGDARDFNFLNLVRTGQAAQAVFIDPPYNIAIAGFASGKGRYHHENLSKRPAKCPSRIFSLCCMTRFRHCKTPATPRH